MNINTPDWVKDAIFYQIFPDRFAQSGRISKKGLHLETWDSPPTCYGFKGGDLLGIVEHLDYLQELGINAIYLNPVLSSASNHRYHTYDYYNIDPLLGGNTAFRELLDEAHARDIRIVPDGVFNHASRGLWQFHHVLENGGGSPYVDWFHFDQERLSHQKHWGAYPGPEEQHALANGVGSYHAIGYQAWWNLPALPKFNTGNPVVRDFIWDVAEYWVRFGIDGWRLDVPAEINDDSFWQEFRRRVKQANSEAYIVGEIWHESQRWLQGDQFDAVMNYLLTGALLGWLIGDRLPEDIFRIGDYHKYLRPLNAKGFGDRIDYLLGLYAPAINAVQLNLLDSHDTPRFVTTAGGDQSAWELGQLFIFTYIGTPCIYYGDEIGLTGRNDPECRKAFPWNQAQWDMHLLHFTKKLISLRKSQPALRRGSYHRLYAENDVFAFGRKFNGDKIIIAINASFEPRTADIPVTALGLQAGSLTTLFGDGQAHIIGGHVPGLALAPRSGIVLKS